MGFSEEDLRKLYATMSHPVRRRILHFLDKKGKATFTNLMNELDLSETGKLSYHLTQMQPLIAQDERKRYYLSGLGKLAIGIERKAMEELELKVQRPRADTSLYWLVIVLCGILGWMISHIPLNGMETRTGLIVSGIFLGALLAYKFRIGEYQSAKAGSILGIVIGILMVLLDGHNLGRGFHPILLFPLYIIAMILPLSITCLMVSTVSTSLLYTVFQMRPHRSEKKVDPLFRLTIKNPLILIILGSLLLVIVQIYELGYLDFGFIWCSFFIWGIVVQVLLILMHRAR